MPDFTSEQIKQLGRGGVWTDSNLEDNIDWAGEQGSTLAAEDENKTHQPMTARQQDDSILKKNDISPDALNVIVRRVEQALLKTGDPTDTSVVSMIERRQTEQEAKLQAWIDNIRIPTIDDNATQTKIEDIERKLAKLDERVVQIELKIDYHLAIATKQGAEEASVLQEVKNLLKERRPVDESEIGSLPSIYDRIGDRTGKLLDTLTEVEPMIPSMSQTLTTSHSRRQNARSKFGKIM